MPLVDLGQNDRDAFRSAIVEQSRRSTEALRLFRPMARQLPFFRSTASERVVRGGNQCTSLSTPIWTNRGLLPAADVCVGDSVIGGTVVAKHVSQNTEPTFKCLFEGGFELVCNRQHPLLTKDGFVEFQNLKNGTQVKLALGLCVWPETSQMTPDDGYFSGLMIGDGCVTHRYGVMSITSGDAETLGWVEKYLATMGIASYGDSKPIEIRWSSAALKEKMQYLWGWDICTAYTKRIPCEVWKSREVARQFLRGYTDADGCVYTNGKPKERQVIWISVSEHLLRDVQQMLLGFGVYATLTSQEPDLEQKRPTRRWRLRARGPYADVFMSRVGTGLHRKSASYVPLCADNEVPSEKWVRLLDKFYCHDKHVVGFTVAPTNTYVTGGLCSHNSGKSMCCAVEFASAATGLPVIGPDGKPLPFKFPRNRKLVLWVIGYDEKHIGVTVHSRLFEPGAFDVIRDKETGALRAWDPTRPDDLARESEKEPAPPLIPARMIEGGKPRYDKVSEKIFTVCRLKNGNEIRAYSSKSVAGQGVAVDLIWIDEDIEYPKHVSEWQARLSKVRGRIIWSAWPHSKNEALVDMSNRAQQQKHLPKPDVFEIVLRFSDNPYMPEDEKRKRLAGWSDEERRSRDEGQFMTDLVLVFPNFDRDVHCIPGVGPEDVLEAYLRKNSWCIPADWTHYLALDPGHAHPAVGFLAVPPPEFGDYLVFYDELYVPQVTADEIAELIYSRSTGRFFHSFIIDHRFGRQSAAGVGKSYREIYAEAFERHNLKSKTTGSSFMWGSDNIASRNMLVRQAMAINAAGKPRLRFMADTTPHTQRQFLLYKKRVVKDEVREEVVDRHHDLMDALGYIVASNPEYVRPGKADRILSPGERAWNSFKKRRDEREFDNDTVYCSAGSAREGNSHPYPDTTDW